VGTTLVLRVRRRWVGVDELNGGCAARERGGELVVIETPRAQGAPGPGRNA
jgi:hypothetical protein